MAAADYYLCDVCGAKAVYDSDWYDRVDHEEGGFDRQGWRGDMRIICDECAKTHKVIIVPKDALYVDRTVGDKGCGHNPQTEEEKLMRFLSDDGETFATQTECIEHERKVGAIAGEMLKAEEFVDTLDKPDRSKQMYRRCIREYLVWSSGKEQEEG